MDMDKFFQAKSIAIIGVSKDPKKVTDYLYKLSVLFRGSDVVCRIHKKHDNSLPEKCTLCVEE